MADILGLIEEGCRGRGAISFLPGETTPLPVADLWRKSAGAARAISTRLGRGARVAGVLSASSASVATLLATWRVGGTFASLPNPARGVDPEVYVEQLLRMCGLVDAHLLVIEAAYRPLLPEVPLDVATFEELVEGPPGGTVAEGGGGALVQFTSGSTGQPKGIHLTLEAIAANVLSTMATLEIGSGDAVCSWLPLSHDMGLIGMCLTPLAANAPRFGFGDIILIDPAHFLKKPASWLAACSELGATVTGAPNFGLESVLRGRRSGSPLDLRRLRAVITGAERVRADTLRRFESAFGPAGLSPEAICPAYGLAEATLAVSMVPPGQRWTSRVVDAHDLAEGAWRELGSEQGMELVSNGPPIPDVAVRCRSDGGGSIGVIEVAGPTLLDSYVGADLHLTDDGWFTTADLGHVADGELFVVARTDDVLVIAGQNYYATDLELAATHEVIRPGAVAAVSTTNGRYVLVAEPTDGSSMAELSRACRDIRVEQLRRTGAAPAAIVFITPKTLAKTPSGKLQRFRIRAALEAAELPVVTRLDFDNAAIADPRGASQ